MSPILRSVHGPGAAPARDLLSAECGAYDRRQHLINSQPHSAFSASSGVFQGGPFHVRFRNEASERDGRADRESSVTGQKTFPFAVAPMARTV